MLIFNDFFKGGGERDKMRGLSSILSLYCNTFNKFNKTAKGILDSIYQRHFVQIYFEINSSIYSRGTKVEKMLTLAPEMYTAEFCIVAKVILWCI